MIIHLKELHRQILIIFYIKPFDLFLKSRINLTSVTLANAEKKSFIFYSDAYQLRFDTFI